MSSNGKPSSGAIDRAAGPAVAVSAVPAVLAALAGRRRSALSLLALPAAVTAFFRDPDRTPDHRQVDSDLILAPADGRVMYAGPAQDEVAPLGEWQQVSIFLSVFDVHINRTPYGGTVEEVTYRPGKWHAAYRFESATENERSEITVSDTVDGEVRRIVFRQIVGLVARRVVTRVQKGDVLRTGQRIGLMKFGSRMDVFVPLHVELTSAVGDKTVAGETVIGRWPSPESPAPETSSL
jgi:phosphatidylserine decarboxylase